MPGGVRDHGARRQRGTGDGPGPGTGPDRPGRAPRGGVGPPYRPGPGGGHERAHPQSGHRWRDVVLHEGHDHPPSPSAAARRFGLASPRSRQPACSASGQQPGPDTALPQRASHRRLGRQHSTHVGSPRHTSPCHAGNRPQHSRRHRKRTIAEPLPICRGVVVCATVWPGAHQADMGVFGFGKGRRS
jgi:hypothetical protein